MHLGTSHKDRHSDNTIERVQRSAAQFVTGDYRRTSSVSDMCTDLMWNSLYTRRRIRDANMFLKIHHGLMHISLPVIITIADARTRRQHKHKLRTLPATCTPYQQSFYVRCMYSTVERTYRGSCHRIYRRSVPESRHPSHSDIDIIIDCFSVNHGLPAFLIYY